MLPVGSDPLGQHGVNPGVPGQQPASAARGAEPGLEAELQELTGLVQRLEANINRVVLGKHQTVRLCVVALLAGEHLLLEDVPGVGKTLLGKAIARSVSGVFRRIQFTPDLLPADITGSSLYEAHTGSFRFCEGPVFANILLADEINRTTPRTQSALLEAMSERQVSVDGQSYPLPQPFMVIATQNPIEFEGTYPLPESQMDRFLMRISVGYPGRAEQLEVLQTHRQGEPVDQLQAVLTAEQVLRLQAAVRQVHVEPSVANYLLDIVQATRDCPELHVGVSMRGMLVYYRACQALAFLEGRSFVVPDDVKALAVPVLAHRVIPKGYLHGGQRSAVEALIQRLVEEVPVPT
ncbi:MAG: MoxR family ATPase [Thermoguttaceae bacterium]|nr:MoxR family ATPase [Thermoguttaceae bacterium]